MSICENEESINAKCSGEGLVCTKGSARGISGPRAPSEGFSHCSPPPPPPLSPILSVLALWPQCCSWTRLVLCVVVSQDLALVFSHQERPSPGCVHGSLLTSCRCSQPRHLCPPPQTCDPLLHFFFFLELITTQLPVCFTYLYFYLPCYFPLKKV